MLRAGEGHGVHDHTCGGRPQTQPGETTIKGHKKGRIIFIEYPAERYALAHSIDLFIRKVARPVFLEYVFGNLEAKPVVMNLLKKLELSHNQFGELG